MHVKCAKIKYMYCNTSFCLETNSEQFM